MRVAELKALTRERGLISYSKLRKADLIGLLRNNQQRTIPLQIRFRQHTQQEMDIFEQQEMSKS